MSALALKTATRPADRWAERLEQQGYCIIPGLIDADIIAALSKDLDGRFAKTPFCEGDFYGARTKRFGGLLKRSAHASPLVAHPLILDISREILGRHCDRMQLNLTQAIEIHPGQRAQAPHRDQNMWRGPTGEIEYLINVMWPFTPYRRENGATMIWPGSHKRPDVWLPPEEAVYAEMAPGDALVFLGSTLHCGGANSTLQIRRGAIISYCLGWLKPYENQWLVYPPEIARRFPRDLAALVGYQQHRPNLGNVEGRCPSVLLQDNVPDYLGAADELSAEQAQFLAAYYAMAEQSAPITLKEIPK